MSNSVPKQNFIGAFPSKIVYIVAIFVMLMPWDKIGLSSLAISPALALFVGLIFAFVFTLPNASCN
ncbi:MAG: hypothetical protein K2I94_04535, partial [Muribaculaceae bacterium]|nr:hypothetical protein [Muribaculaceae bacterium]